MSGGIGGKLSDKACKAFAAQKARGSKLPDGRGLHPTNNSNKKIKRRPRDKPLAKGV